MTQTIRFYKTKGPYGAFSNFSRHAIFVDGKIWRTSEHYFQAMKRGDPALQEEIRRTIRPGDAAMMGRDRSHPILEGWDEFYRVDYMMEALRAKFTQHPDLRELLLSTGDAELVEDSNVDYYWGCGERGTGENMLGKLLMKLRKEIK